MPFYEANKSLRRQVIENFIRKEKERKETNVITLKPQVETNEKQLKDIPHIIINRKSDSVNDNSSALTICTRMCKYGYVLKTIYCQTQPITDLRLLKK